MAYDGARGVTVLFGGFAAGGYGQLGDTWEWDGASWTLRSQSGPTPRESHAMVYDGARARVLLLFGGDDGSSQGDTWEYGIFDSMCSGREKIKKTSCKDRHGANQLKVSLTGGIEGDTFIVTLIDGSTWFGAINARGKGKAKFNDRPVGDTGVAVAEWGCGAIDRRDYACP